VSGCPHVRQDLPCSCTAGDEQPNTEHHPACMRRGRDCDPERCLCPHRVRFDSLPPRCSLCGEWLE
jgi:hypothetical protein